MPKVPITVSLQYLSNISNKKGRNEVDFLNADKHKTTLQVDTFNLDGHGHAC